MAEAIRAEVHDLSKLTHLHEPEVWKTTALGRGKPWENLGVCEVHQKPWGFPKVFWDICHEGDFKPHPQKWNCFKY